MMGRETQRDKRQYIKILGVLIIKSEFMGAPHAFRLLGHRSSGFVLKFQLEAFPEEYRG